MVVLLEKQKKDYICKKRKCLARLDVRHRFHADAGAEGPPPSDEHNDRTATYHLLSLHDCNGYHPLGGRILFFVSIDRSLRYCFFSVNLFLMGRACSPCEDGRLDQYIV